MPRKIIEVQPNEGIDKSGHGAEYVAFAILFAATLLAYILLSNI